MTNRALTFFSLPALATALLIAAPASAQTTNCQPGDLFCAELQIGPGRAGVRIGPAQGQPLPPPPVVVQPAPPPPTVVVEPVQPPTVIVQPAPPPPPPPQPPMVIVQPQPPPPPVQQYPVQQYYVQPVQQRVVVRQDRFPYSSIGLHLHPDGVVGENLGMGGGGGAVRFRPLPFIGIDLGASIYGGQDYNGLDRVEVPVQADVLFFFNPYNRFQFYALVGAGASFSHADGVNIHTGGLESRDYAHLGGEAGVGVEWRISRVFALNLDVRGFIRQRVDGDERPEFTEHTSSGWQSTDTSGGFVGRVGMTFYFGN